MISLIWILGFLCRSSIFRYPDDLRNIVQQCARWVLVEKKGGREGERGGESSLIITRERESVSSLLYNSALLGGGSLFS